jgi:signal transduction histidine kinase
VSEVPQRDREVLIAANRAVVCETVGRWLVHALRGPVQAFSLAGDLLGPGTVPEPAVCETIEESAVQLRERLDLLDRSLRPAPRPSEPGPVALAGVIGHLSALHACNPAGVVLDAAVPPLRSLPAVRGSEDRLAHALLNLVMNAREAIAGRGRGTIRLTGRADDDARKVTLVMEDDGPGVAAEVRDRLFEPFVTTKTGRLLAGLGLAVSRWLVEESEGTVRHEPQARGARFVVELAAWPPALNGPIPPPPRPAPRPS